MRISIRPLRSALLATAALAVSAGVVAASQSGWALQNAATRMSGGVAVAAGHVSAPSALQALSSAASHAQSGLATAAANTGTQVPDDVVSLVGTHRPSTAGKPTAPSADGGATDPLDALADAAAAAHAGLTKAGDAITNNPTSNDDQAWTGLNTASAAIDAGLAKAADAVGSHH